MALSARGRLEKCAGAPLAIQPRAPLDRRERHSKGLDDVSLAGGAIDDELRGKKAKAGQILGAVGEHRQMAIEVNHLVRLSLEGQFRVDGGRANWKHRQL